MHSYPWNRRYKRARKVEVGGSPCNNRDKDETEDKTIRQRLQSVYSHVQPQPYYQRSDCSQKKNPTQWEKKKREQSVSRPPSQQHNTVQIQCTQLPSITSQ